MIIIFEGRMGSGKSLASTAFAVLEYVNNERKIVSNSSVFGLPEEAFEKLDYEKLVMWMKNEEVLENVTLVLDEAYLFIDSRMSQSGLNKLVTYLILQTRKRNMDMYINTQQFENVDIRLRKNADIRCMCRFSPQTQIVSIRLIDLRGGKRKKIRLYGPEWFPFFDTKEVPTLRPAHTKITL